MLLLAKQYSFSKENYLKIKCNLLNN